MESTHEWAVSEVARQRKAGWINTPDPVELTTGNWVLQEVRVITYDLGKKRNEDRCFFAWECAQQWLLNAGSTIYNLYRFGSDGWRTDY